MSQEVIIKIEQQEEFSRFLSMNDFEVEDLENSVYRVSRNEELPVFVKIEATTIYFEVDLGNINEIGSKELFFQFLDMNTEILPVAFGINNANPEDPHLVLVESRETCSLNDHEILSVFDALELAVDKAEEILSTRISKA
jgi:uncharacterized protein YjfI (DUF2170 family)